MKPLSNLWIKICGITRQQDALAAAELGASALGLNFYKLSPRCVDMGRAEEILEGLPESVRVVALFVDPEPEDVVAVVSSGLVDLLQFHGNESAQYCESFDLPYMKAIRVGSELDLSRQIADFRSAEFILLDSFDEKVPGGTGKSFDWNRIETIVRSESLKLVLAGGLNPENIRQAIARVAPFGVDVSSGVELSPGIKDPQKLKSFIEGARSV
ncbi:MAG: phosphoribosylanthranilate isomerase [Proteobacteria bacterium]|nr:phosphoribosylanthranilate isomerase [Pseudomonadota bacterium]